jgi:ATP adenylyltransferase
MNDNLWAPWRMQYIRGIDQPAGPVDGSFLSNYWQHPDRDKQNCVIHRSEHSFIVLNRYPYTNGHLMVAPGECVADLPMLNSQQRADLMEMVILAERLLQAAMNPQGVNIGINVGRCAGAGLPSHLHVHVVPRWAGDTNFMTVVGQVRVAPQALEEVRDELLAVLPKVLGGK